MRPFSGSIRLQGIYEALIPFKMEYPYKIVTEDNRVEIKSELFPEEKENDFIDEAQKIEIGTTYKLRPVIVISQSEISDDTYLALPLTKKKEEDTKKYREHIIAICENKIKERHFLFQKKYSDTLNFDSFVLVDTVHLVTKNNIYKHRGRLDKQDYDVIRAKLKSVLSLNPPS